AWVIWRVARHLVRPTPAAFAGILALFWPLADVLFGARERGFYPATAALGMCAVLSAVNIDEGPGRVAYWVAFGFAVGVGWWVSPNIIYYAVPLVVWLAVRGQWRHWRNVAIGGIAFVVGATPWLIANLHSGFASLT